MFFILAAVFMLAAYIICEYLIYMEYQRHNESLANEGKPYPSGLFVNPPDPKRWFVYRATWQEMFLTCLYWTPHWVRDDRKICRWLWIYRLCVYLGLACLLFHLSEWEPFSF